MSRALPPVDDTLGTRLFAFLSAAAQRGYADPQTVEAFERLRTAADAAQLLSAEDQEAEDTVNQQPELHLVPPVLMVLEGGLLE